MCSKLLHINLSVQVPGKCKVTDQQVFSLDGGSAPIKIIVCDTKSESWSVVLHLSKNNSLTSSKKDCLQKKPFQVD